ncbi:ABC transporter ATP-binding protein [Neobacillus vireti]|uniref:ABC transporter n=1 Tax=Neobacillus vireti LMG 21834 TaxID=1131730 RepID=A0AB94IMY2_9BACI|nr:ABC transporter ATP-binding protein [Neobacillus vireti]ETI68476.1 ABC transporter [Neobacillus vireti LMG 21834]KLT17755.1 ABC transporter [Neobacillus vireti]
METALEVKGITKRYKSGRGVRDIRFDIAKGDIFGLNGPNGAGKTTLLKIIIGLIRPDHGSVTIFGNNTTDQFEQAMKQVGCMIETADSYDYLSAYDNLKLSARFYPELPRTRIDEVLEQVGLAPYKKEKVNGFSLGMKQRLRLASALLSKPKLVILDEPTNGLDIEGIVNFRNTIQQLACEHGITFLISSHMINELSLIAGRIGIMQNGQLIRVGGVNELVKPGITLEQYIVSQLHTSKEGDHDDHRQYIK